MLHTQNRYIETRTRFQSLEDFDAIPLHHIPIIKKNKKIQNERYGI